MRDGLNAKHQIDCAKMHKAGVPAAAIARRLHTTVGVVEKFTYETLAEGKKAKQQAEQNAKRREGTVSRAHEAAGSGMGPGPGDQTDLGKKAKTPENVGGKDQFK